MWTAHPEGWAVPRLAEWSYNGRNAARAASDGTALSPLPRAPVSTPASASTAAAKQAAVWEDFVDIFYAPSQVFERRRAGQFGLALLILTVLMTAVFFIVRGGMQSVMDVEFQRKAAEAMAKNPKITMEMMEKSRAIGEKFGWVFVLVGTPIMAFVIGILLWIGGKIGNGAR